jgi:hypothetical protein
LKVFVGLEIVHLKQALTNIKIFVSGHTSEFECGFLRIGFLLKFFLDLIVIFLGVIENFVSIAGCSFVIELELFFFTNNWFNLLDWWILLIIIRELCSKEFHGHVGIWVNTNLRIGLEETNFGKHVESLCLGVGVSVGTGGLNVSSNVLNLIQQSISLGISSLIVHGCLWCNWCRLFLDWFRQWLWVIKGDLLLFELGGLLGLFLFLFTLLLLWFNYKLFLWWFDWFWGWLDCCCWDWSNSFIFGLNNGVIFLLNLNFNLDFFL